MKMMGATYLLGYLLKRITWQQPARFWSSLLCSLLLGPELADRINFVGLACSDGSQLATTRTWGDETRTRQKKMGLFSCQTSEVCNSTTRHAIGTKVMSIRKYVNSAFKWAQNEGKRTSGAEVIANGRPNPKINLVLSSCVEMGKSTQQPAWVGQDRSFSSTIFNHLATGAN